MPVIALPDAASIRRGNFWLIENCWWLAQGPVYLISQGQDANNINLWPAI